jgi:hypothetical protein
LDDDDTSQLNALLSDINVRIRFAAAEYLNNTVLKEVAVNAEGTHTSLLLCSLLCAVTNRTSLGLNRLGLPQARRTHSASS